MSSSMCCVACSNLFGIDFTGKQKTKLKIYSNLKQNRYRFIKIKYLKKKFEIVSKVEKKNRNDKIILFSAIKIILFVYCKFNGC